MRNKYTFYEDPGHGWLEIPERLVLESGAQISKYSYRAHGNVYLEEDCDLAAYLRAAGVKNPSEWFTANVTVKYVETHALPFKHRSLR